MTNEERVADVLSSLRGLRLKPSEQAACLAKRGLIAPDPPQRYRAVDRFVWGGDPEAPVLDFLAATADERDAVLAALNALPEVVPHAGGIPAGNHAVTGAAHPNRADNLYDENVRILMAHVEDWQECASHLALALKAAAPVEHRTPDENEAIAEFDRLASEAAKGVEL